MSSTWFSEKPKDDGGEPRLRRSATTLRKPGTQSRCTEMWKRRCKRKKVRSRTHMPRAMDRAFQQADSEALLSVRKLQWTGRWLGPNMRCMHHKRATWAASSQEAMKCWGLASGGNQGNRLASAATEKECWKQHWRPSGRRTKPPRPALEAQAQASA